MRTCAPHRRRATFELLEDRSMLDGNLPGVPHVEDQFQALKHHGEAIGWFLPEDQGAPDPSSTDHYQGIARYPGTGTPILYVTQLDDDDSDSQGRTAGGYLEVVRLGSRDTDGERLRSNLQANAQSNFFNTGNTFPPAEDTWLSAIRFNGIGVEIDGQRLRAYNHPGGMAIVDNILFVAMDQPSHCGDPGGVFPPCPPDGPGFGGVGMIVLFDLGQNGEWRETPQPIQALSLDHGIDNLAVTETSSGQYLVWVNGDGGRVTRFYRTSGADLRENNLQLELVQIWDPSSPDDFQQDVPVPLPPQPPPYSLEDSWPTETGAHQSSAFIRQWDGQTPPADAPLYLIGMRHPGGSPFTGADNVDLYRVTDNGLGGFKLSHLRTLHMFVVYDGVGRIGNFAAGNNAYVSPSGELILYSVQHDDEDGADPDYVKMAEFRHRDVNWPDSPLRRPVTDAGGPYSVAEGGTITLNGSGLLRADRPWIELFDDNNGWLHDFERSDEMPGDRSIVVDYDDRHLFELNNFEFLDNFGDKTSSVRWRLPVGLNVELFEDENFDSEGSMLILRGTGQTEWIGDLDDFDFGDAISSMRFVGSPPGLSALMFEWDLDGDGVFGETGGAATRGNETTPNPLFSAAGLDGPGTWIAGLRIRDDAGLSDVSTAIIRLTNVAPTIDTLTSSNPDPMQKSADGMVSVGGTFADPAGPLDTHTVAVDWGDGTPSDTLPASSVDQASDSFSHVHTYASGGIFVVTVSVADEDGGISDARTTTAVVSGVGLVDRVLYIIGTGGGDDVHVKVKDDGTRLDVDATLADDPPFNASFPTSAVDRLVVILCDGDDRAIIQDKVTIDTFVLAGDGADRVFGGGGHNVLVGGGGDDHLFGGGLDDILIGGNGNDRLHGKKGNDILIGGFTDNDDDLEALAAALAAWKEDGLSEALIELISINDDGEEDHLYGGLGDDQLFGGIGEILKE
jgi:hypothetical protein